MMLNILGNEINNLSLTFVESDGHRLVVKAQ